MSIRAGIIGTVSLLFAAVVPCVGHAGWRLPFVRVHTGPGGVHVRAPFVSVTTGGPVGGVRVRAPFVHVEVPPSPPPYYVPPPPVVVPAPVPPRGSEQPEVIPAPRPQPQQPGREPSSSWRPAERPDAPPFQAKPSPAPQGPDNVQAVSHYEFARSFRPFPGKHSVWLIHPYTRRPVNVTFLLPPGRPQSIDVNPDSIEIDYDNFELDIRFNRDGTVSVEYDE